MIYACSDIHGQYDKFLMMLKKINFQKSDELYILGDVIDRGPKPIDLLLHVLDEPNMHLLIGNHEYMMLQAIRFNDYHSWIRNGCRTTIRQLKQMPESSIDHLLDAIEQLPIVIPEIEVCGKKFYLAHAGMADKLLKGPLFLPDTEKQDITDVLWKRKLAMGMHPRDTVSPDVYEKYKGHIVLFGHTISQRCPFGKCTPDGSPRISPNYGETVFNLDCGCARGKTLGFLRLDDMSEYYV